MKYFKLRNNSILSLNDAKNLEDLNLSVKPFILRRKKEDVVKSLPEKIVTKVYIDLPNTQKCYIWKYLMILKKKWM